MLQCYIIDNLRSEITLILQQAGSDAKIGPAMCMEIGYMSRVFDYNLKQNKWLSKNKKMVKEGRKFIIK